MSTSAVPSSKPERLYSVAELAASFGLHELTIRRKIWANEIKSIKLGARCIRVRQSALDEYLADRSAAA